jgi:hypothetical protein
MDQVHKRFTSEQVRFLFQAYLQGKMSRTDLQETLGIGKSRFFSLLKVYRQSPETFSVSYERSTPPRVSPTTDTGIKHELEGVEESWSGGRLTSAAGSRRGL